jgi:type IV pilus assembly protein PilF
MPQRAQFAPFNWASWLVQLLFLSMTLHCPLAQAQGLADAHAPQLLLRTQTRLTLGLAYFQVGLPVFAMEEVDQALALMPQHAQALLLKALLFQQQNKLDLAQKFFSQAMAAGPINPQIALEFGRFECQTGQFEKAIQTFQLAMLHSSGLEKGKVNWIWGQCLVQNKQFEAANLRMSDAFLQLPDLISEVLALVDLKIQLGKLSEAEKILEYLNDSPSVSAQSVWVAFQLAERQNQAVKKNHWGKMLGLRYSNSAQWRALQDRATHE